MTRVVVAYDHDPADLGAVDLAVAGGPPDDADWLPALRTTVDGQRVVWVRAVVPAGARVWLRDRDGPRQVRRL